MVEKLHVIMGYLTFYPFSFTRSTTSLLAEVVDWNEAAFYHDRPAIGKQK